MQITMTVLEGGHEKESRDTKSIVEGVHETTDVNSDLKTIEESDGVHEQPRINGFRDAIEEIKAKYVQQEAVSVLQNVMEVTRAKYSQQEADLVKLLVVLKQQDDDLDVKQKTMLEDYQSLSTGMLESLQRLQEQREGLKLRLSDLQQQSSSLRPVIKKRETQLEEVRAKARRTGKYLGEWIRKGTQSLWDDEIRRRVGLEGELKRSEQNLESEKVKLMRVEAHVEVSERNLEVEKVKRVKLEADVVLSKENLEAEKQKMLCIICMEATRDTLCLPCGHLNCCSSCLVEHRKDSNTCPTCRSTISVLLNSQHILS